jgi:hypothetical protein
MATVDDVEQSSSHENFHAWGNAALGDPRQTKYQVKAERSSQQFHV